MSCLVSLAITLLLVMDLIRDSTAHDARYLSGRRKPEIPHTWCCVFFVQVGIDRKVLRYAELGRQKIEPAGNNRLLSLHITLVKII